MQEIKREKKILEKRIKNLRVGSRKCMRRDFFDGDKKKNVDEYHKLNNQIKSAKKRLAQLNEEIRKNSLQETSIVI